MAARYTANGSKLTIGQDLISTMMACPEPVMQEAGAYITVLTQTASYRSDGQQLTLLDASGKPLASFTAQNSQLEGSSWVVTGYNNGKQAAVSILAESKLTAIFGSDGKLNGSAGCNNYTATFQVNGEGLKISAVGSTRMMCDSPAGVMEQENLYLTVLATAATYRIEGSQLELRTAEGTLCRLV